MNRTKLVSTIISFLVSVVICNASEQADKYAITYLLDGKPYYSENYYAGEVIKPIAAPQKNGYVFSGWKNLPSVMPAYNIEVSGSLLIERYSGLTGMKVVKVDSVMFKLANMTVEDYLNLDLPPLDVLYENARTSYAVKYYEYEAEYYLRDVKSAKREPLSWLKFVGAFSYGNSDMAAILVMQTTYQVLQQNVSRQRNMYYNGGVTLNIPLGELINNRNSVKQRQAKYEQTLSRMEAELTMTKERIIELYSTIIESMSVLSDSFETLVIAQAQYENAENEFINNNYDAEALYRSKTFVRSAKQDYESNKRRLNEALLTLEIVSCTPIVSK